MVITEAKYFKNSIENVNVGIFCKIDDVETSVPMDTANRHYKEIMRQVEEGTLTIQEAADAVELQENI